VSKYDR